MVGVAVGAEVVLAEEVDIKLREEDFVVRHLDHFEAVNLLRVEAECLVDRDAGDIDLLGRHSLLDQATGGGSRSGRDAGVYARGFGALARVPHVQV